MHAESRAPEQEIEEQRPASGAASAVSDWALPHLRVLERYGVASLLVVVAFVHVYFVHAKSLTAWKGGGFGMFSTVDAGRVLRFELIDDRGISYRATVPDDAQVRELHALVRKLPSETNVERLVHELARCVWLSPRGAGPAFETGDAPRSARDDAPPAPPPPFGPLDRELQDAARRLERLEPWKAGGSARDRLRVLRTVRLEVLKPAYDRATRRYQLVPLLAREAPGLTVDEIAARAGLTPDYVRNHWAQ
jgi:hypothetical protein